jgi:hypothetical protein
VYYKLLVKACIRKESSKMSLEASEYVEVLTRLVCVENRLSSTIEKIDTLIARVEARFNNMEKIYMGDSVTPSLVSRVLDLEKTKTAVNWMLGVVFTAVVGLLFNVLHAKI